MWCRDSRSVFVSLFFVHPLNFLICMIFCLARAFGLVRASLYGSKSYVHVQYGQAKSSTDRNKSWLMRSERPVARLGFRFAEVEAAKIGACA